MIMISVRLERVAAVSLCDSMRQLRRGNGRGQLRVRVDIASVYEYSNAPSEYVQRKQVRKQ